MAGGHRAVRGLACAERAKEARLIHAVIGLEVPIYTGGALTAKIKIATAKREQAVAQYGAVVLTAFNEVEGALTNQELLAQRLPYQQNALADRSEAVRIARVKYKAGQIDLLSVLQLQEAQINSQAAVIKLRNAQLANRIQLHLALGGSFDNQPTATVTEESAAASGAVTTRSE